jgi:hypothetical protein
VQGGDCTREGEIYIWVVKNKPSADFYMTFPLCHIKVPPTLHTKRHISINMNNTKLSLVATYPAWCNR